MSLINKYFERLRAHIDAIESDIEPIQKAAKLCADALARGGVIHIFDSGHLVSHELINRAGGLVAFSRLAFKLNVTNPVKSRAASEPEPGNSLAYGYIHHVFSSNQLRAGDVLFVGSVSGKSATVVELALQGQAHGLTVIAITAMDYSPKLESQHPSGKHLFEAADLVLDNHAPYGDGMLDVKGLDYPLCPASGIGAVATLWAVVAGLVEEMLAQGLTPTVFPSVNRPNGVELVRKAETTAMEKGY